MKKRLLLAAMCLSASAFGQVVPDQWDRYYTGNGNKAVWTMGGVRTEVGGAARGASIAAAREARWALGASLGLNAITEASPLLADGRAVGLTVTRVATAAGVFQAVKALSGPVGISLVLLEAMPAILAWIAGDNAQHIRVGADGHSLEKAVPCTACTGDMYSVVGFGATLYGSRTSACRAAVGATGYAEQSGSVWLCYSSGGYGGYMIQTTTVPVTGEPTWMPASMDDIAPYMTTRSPPVTLPEQIIAAGGSIPVTPVSVDTTAAPPVLAPFVQTTDYPKPPDQTTRVETPGNPLGLPLNTPTVTRNVTGSGAVAAGSSSSTGVNTSGSPINAPGTVTAPMTSVDTSVWDGTKTTTTTVVSQNGAQVQSTTNAVTNIANTTNTSTVNIVNTTTTTVTDTTTNQPLAPPTTDTSTQPVPDPTTSDLCKLHPEILACATLGAPPASEVLDKKTEAVTVTAIAFAGGGGCPAPLGFTVYAHSYAISYQPLCDKLIVLKFIFMSLAAVMAAYILADSFRVS